MGALSILSSAVNNFNPTASVLAGGGASILTFAVGTILVAAGVSIPFLNVPITMTMVAALAPTIGHLVTAFVPDTYNQQINSLAKKLQTNVDNIKVLVPQVYQEYPNEVKATDAITTNLKTTDGSNVT